MKQKEKKAKNLIVLLVDIGDNRTDHSHNVKLLLEELLDSGQVGIGNIRRTVITSSSNHTSK